MKRRNFIALMGSSLVLIANNRLFSPFILADDDNRIKRKQLEVAIMGSFGSGFRLVSAEQNHGETRAVIEHQENYLEVKSSDLTDWAIVRATKM